MDTVGLTLIDILSAIYDRPRTMQSNFARENARLIGEAASLGLITTIVAKGNRGCLATNEWRLTVDGLKYLHEAEGWN